MKMVFRCLPLLALALMALPADAKPFSDLDKSTRFLRDRNFDLVHTRIDVEVDVQAGRVAGTTTVLVDGLVDGRRELVLDAVDMDILKVNDTEGRALSYGYDSQVIVIDLGRAVKRKERAGVVVTFVARPKSGMHFVRPSKARKKLKLQAWTQGEDEYTRHWTPCYDFPDDMGTSETLVTVKQGLKVLSNGKLLGTKSLGEKVRWHWSQQKPHVTYLIMLGIGEWTVSTRDWRGLEVSFWSVDEDQAWVDRTFLPTLEMLDFFADVAGLSYPWAKYAQVTVTDFFWGGMENTSATVLTRDTLHDARAEEDYSSQGLVAHELAHQWFGDLLTCRGWSELWLNEGFATYFSSLYGEHKDGWDSFIGQMYRSRGWLDGELKRYKRPIVTHAYEHPGDMFDGHSYNKGAWVLHALRGWINDDTLWWSVIRNWVRRHKHQVVETSEFRRSVEKTTGLSLGRFFQQWIYRAGLPAVKVEPSWDRATKTLRLNVSQTQKTDRWVPLFKLPLDVRISAQGSVVLEKRFWIEEGAIDFVIPLPKRPDLVEIDPRGWTPGTVEIAWDKPGALLALRQGSSVVTRARAARRLAKWVGDDAVADALTAQGHQEGEWVGAEIVKTLAKLNSNRARVGLLSLVDHTKSRVRASVADALVHYGSEEGVESAVKALLKDSSYRVLAAVAGNYWKYKLGKGIGPLKRLVTSYSPWHVVSGAAFASMSRLNGKKALRHIRDAIKPSKHRRLREGAYRALGRIGERHSSLQDAALELAAEGLRDPVPNVRRGAIDAFEVAGRGDKIPQLAVFLRRESHRRTRRHAEAALSKLQALAADPVGDLRDRLTTVETEKKAMERRMRLLEERLKAERSRPHGAP